MSNLKFEVVPKKPKDKIKVSRDKTIIGFIDFDFSANEYQFIASFEIHLTESELRLIASRISDIVIG